MTNQRDDRSGSRKVSRRTWPVRKYRLGEEPSDDLSGSTTPARRLEMMWPLAFEAWSLTGKPLPDYARSETPIRRTRRQASERT